MAAHITSTGHRTFHLNGKRCRMVNGRRVCKTNRVNSKIGIGIKFGA